MNDVKLKLDWCSYKAAKYAVENFHYSKCMPVGKSVKIGVWENDKFIGCVIFSRGNTPHIGNQFNLKQTEIIELTRVALTNHKTHVTRIVSIAMRMLKKQSPDIKAIISYADQTQGHEGKIYKAGNWEYLGVTKPITYWTDGTKKIHSRLVTKSGIVIQFGRKTKAYSSQNLTKIKEVGKHKFIYYLDKTLCGDSVNARTNSISEVA